MTRRAKRLGALVPVGLVLAVLSIGLIVATGAAGAPRPSNPWGFFRVTASLTPGQTVPANTLAPTTATGQFDAFLMRTTLRAVAPKFPTNAPKRGGCHGIVAPIHSSHPTKITCTKSSATATGPVHWRLAWRLSLTGLSGPATSAAIRLGQPGAVGPTVIPLCGPCGAASNGISFVTPDQATSLAKGNAYVDVQTAQSPNGEVRGQIRALAPLVKAGG